MAQSLWGSVANIQLRGEARRVISAEASDGVGPRLEMKHSPDSALPHSGESCAGQSPALSRNHPIFLSAHD